MPELQILCDSNPANGAKDLAADGSRFTVDLVEGIYLNGAKDIAVSLESAKIWYTFLNVFEDVNDSLYLTVDGTNVTLVLPPGLYELNELLSTLNLLWANDNTTHAGVDQFPLSIIPNWSTQKVILANIDDNEAVSVDFTQPDTFREILGFNSGVVNIPAGQNEDGDEIAKFNVFNNLYVCTDLCAGIRINSNFHNVIAEVPLGKPHSQIVYEPYRPIECSAPELQFQPIRKFSVWLTDEKNNPIHTNGEFWSARLRVSWKE